MMKWKMRMVDKITQHLKINEKVSTDNEIIADNEELRTVNKRLMDDNENIEEGKRSIKEWRDYSLCTKYFNEIKNLYDKINNKDVSKNI